MDGLSVNTNISRISYLAKEKEEKRAQDRKKNLLYLIALFLQDHGFIDTCAAFVKEAHLSSEIEVCDNIDLETILLDYSDYYFIKFNKYPKFCRKGESNLTNIKPKKEKTIKVLDKSLKKLDNENNNMNSGEKTKSNTSILEPNLNFKITPLFPLENSTTDLEKNNSKEPDFDNHKLLKSLNNLYSQGSELQEIACIITKEIVLCDLNVHWDDIKGLTECKSLLKEATVYPIKYPYIFNDRLTPWRGVLLYGPPGTGKTMLAKAVATECKSTFFNITSSCLISKWRGESEKYVRVLLDLAKHYAPSIIFIDEVDWTVSGGTCAEENKKSEPSRRFRAELLARLDGLLSMESNNVLLLAATNVPWELDKALLRRLEKRIYVSLPNESARHQIFKIYIKPELLETLEYDKILKNTKLYSCSDLKLLCKEAWMMQLRPIWLHLENGNSCVNYKNNEGIINLKHLTKAMSIIKPISSNIQSYEIWGTSFFC